MRNGTFVIPRTGERSRRQFTLRTSTDAPSRDGEPTTSLIYAETAGERYHIIATSFKKKVAAAWAWLHTDEGHSVLKCTLAYLLGSTATFWPPLSNFLGHRDGKHIAATLTVYFHPARTVGSMLEAVSIAIIAVAYAELICVLAMFVSIASRENLGLVAPAHVVVLIVFIGGGLGFIGWVKQRMNHPLVNVGSTLASIALISVLTKEESIQDGYFSGEKILQVLKLLLLGISFTVSVNLLVWQVSARKVVRGSMVTAATSLSDKIAFITKGFLDGTEEELKSPEYAQVSAKYNSAYSVLSKTLREAKFEHYFLGHEKIYALDKRIVKSLEGLSQVIGGLRSALDTQFTLLKELPPSEPGSPDPTSSGGGRPLLHRALSSFLTEPIEQLSVIDEATEEDEEPPAVVHSVSDPTNDNSPVFRVPSDIFALFIALLGPSMKSLAYTLSETLRESPFGKSLIYDVQANDQLRQSLRDALDLYNNARGHALHELYRSIELGHSRSEKVQADIEEVAAACGHFSFSLQAVAEEMDSYLDVLEELKHATESRRRSWRWLMWWKRFSWNAKQKSMASRDSEEDELLLPKPVKSIRKSALPKGIPTTMTTQRDTFSWDAAPQASRFLRQASQLLLQVLRFFAREDILFGIKVGIGAILWAMFAFIPGTRPMYQHWRGEWGLLSFMIVVGMTTGASNTSGSSRFLGTLIGAAFACVSWLVCFDNPFILAFLGAVIALWNFYIILVIKNAPLGRVTLLAYNVIVLYAYSLSQSVDDDDDDEGGRNPFIFEISYHRVLAVTLGIVWGMIVCRLLWPISGRRKFREGLAVLYLQLGLIWKRGPLLTMLESNSTADYMREGEQAALQRYAFKLESLRSSAQSEFELRGPFPYDAYGRIMTSTKRILDGFYAMRLITQKRLSLSEGERMLLEITGPERKLLSQRICHVFQVLASCIMLEYPLTDSIPTVDTIKDRLLGKIHQFRRQHMESNLLDAAGDAATIAEEKDYALVYAYTLVTVQVAEELKKVRAEIEGLFGVLNEEALLLE
ncbi:hypothetical protein HJFPF1_01900 [Paramyrothecium foliicola]|nr:hypothetical protein HJFPF1_01900 [Paramyrothecium foliicola]